MMMMISMVIAVGSLGTVNKDLPKNKNEGFGNQWKNRDHPDHDIVKIG